MLYLIVPTIITIAVSFFPGMNRPLHPFATFLWSMLVVFETLIFFTPASIFMLLASVVIVKLVARAEKWNMYMRFSLFMLIFVVLFNILLVHQGEVLWQLGPLTVSAGAVKFAYTMSLRLLVIMGTFAIFTSNVDTDSMFLIFETLRFPEKTYMTLIMALRFFELLSHEAREAMLAFRSRGIPVADTSLKSKIKYRYPVLAVLLKSSLDRAMDIAEVLEVRGFPSGRRRAWKKLEFVTRERVAIPCMIVAAVLSALSLLLPSLLVGATIPLAIVALTGGEGR